MTEAPAVLQERFRNVYSSSQPSSEEKFSRISSGLPRTQSPCVRGFHGNPLHQKVRENFFALTYQRHAYLVLTKAHEHMSHRPEILPPGNQSTSYFPR